VEFAMIVVVLLSLLFGILEAGRLVSTQAMLSTASREAARYGVAVGESSPGVPRYRDCEGMRARGEPFLLLGGNPDILIEYSSGATCENGDAGPGDQLVVTASADHQFLFPFSNRTVTLSAEHERSIGMKAPPS
jgi:hypothetical protein